MEEARKARYEKNKNKSKVKARKNMIREFRVLGSMAKVT